MDSQLPSVHSEKKGGDSFELVRIYERRGTEEDKTAAIERRRNTDNQRGATSLLSVIGIYYE